MEQFSDILALFADDIITKLCAMNALPRSEDSVREEMSMFDIFSMYLISNLNGTEVEDINMKVQAECEKW